MGVGLNALGKGIHRHIQEQDFQFGVEAERERIIKLLEDECECAFYAKYEIPSKCVAHLHIAFIKGENNG